MSELYTATLIFRQLKHYLDYIWNVNWHIILIIIIVIDFSGVNCVQTRISYTIIPIYVMHVFKY